MWLAVRFQYCLLLLIIIADISVVVLTCATFCNISIRVLELTAYTANDHFNRFNYSFIRFEHRHFYFFFFVSFCFSSVFALARAPLSWLLSIFFSLSISFSLFLCLLLFHSVHCFLLCQLWLVLSVSVAHRWYCRLFVVLFVSRALSRIAVNIKYSFIAINFWLCLLSCYYSRLLLSL